ncbi:MAG TPA: NAD(P)H-binding protein [Kofleriaceae bacterium]|nr:NAD(P)H-binding protein [Kofleriaceae bacterium]
MSNRHHLLVFGATGRCGALVVQRAVAAGIKVTAAVRQPVDIPGATLELVDVLNADQTAAVVRRVAPTAVLSCLGQRRQNPANPWSRVTSPPDLLTRASANIIAGMQQHGIARIVVMSAAGVAESASQMSLAIRLMILRTNIRFAYVDSAAMEAQLAHSGLQWCAIRPVTLRSGAVRPAKPTDRYGLLSSIPRAAVAQCMVDLACARHIDNPLPMIG